METHKVDSCVRGHHVFRGIWNPMIGEQIVYNLRLAVALLSYTCALIRARARHRVCIWPALVSNYWRLFVIWRLTSESPNHQIKAVAKISWYTVCCYLKVTNFCGYYNV